MLQCVCLSVFKHIPFVFPVRAAAGHLNATTAPCSLVWSAGAHRVTVVKVGSGARGSGSGIGVGIYAFAD